jgi:hypothetical protein
MKKIKSFILVGLLALFINSSVFAQQAGSLTGQVADTFGAVVVGRPLRRLIPLKRKKAS